MSDRSVTNADFTIERTVAAPPERVFKAFTIPEEKTKWFGGPADWTTPEYTFDIREGGWETNKGGPKGGFVSEFRCLYWEIIPNERIVYTYEMVVDGKRISVSLATIEFKPEGDGTRLSLTEHGAYFDGSDDGSGREHGTRLLIDALVASVTGEESAWSSELLNEAG